MKINNTLGYKSRGVTPVIATVLLIGLVVIAGIGVALVVFGTVSTPAPLEVDIISISEFETTDDDIYIDRFSITLHNSERTNVRIKQDAFSLMLRDGSDILGWTMELDQAAILLPALSIQTIPLSCDPSDNQNELIPRNDTIYVDVTVFPEGSDRQRSARTFRSDLLIVGDTFGPIKLETQETSLILEPIGLNLSFNINNLGSTDANLILEFSTDSSNSIYFSINGINRTSFTFLLPKYGSTTLPDEVFTINPIASGVSQGSKHFVLILMKNQADQTPISSLFIELTYQA